MTNEQILKKVPMTLMKKCPTCSVVKIEVLFKGEICNQCTEDENMCACGGGDKLPESEVCKDCL